MKDATDAELAELGLYDPDAPDAHERLELLRIAFESGADVDDARDAIAEGRLHAIAAESLIEDVEERLTVDEVAMRAGVSVEFLRRLWRAFGLSDPDPAARPCSSRDVKAIGALGSLRDQISEDAALQMARAIGASMSRLADTGVSMVRALAEAPLRTAGGSNVDVAHELVRAAQGFMPASLPVMDAVLRHHVVAAGRRYSLWGVRPTERSTSDAVVGFADLVGFTTLGQHLDPAEVDTLIRRFEELALDATTRRPLSRLVKLIGDEALFVAGDMASALEIAHDLARDRDLPPLRVGLAAGVIIVREGDVFGPVVNLASRLVELAEPGQVLLDAEAALRLGSQGCESLGLRTIDGFDEPLEVFAVP